MEVAQCQLEAQESQLLPGSHKLKPLQKKIQTSVSNQQKFHQLYITGLSPEKK